MDELATQGLYLLIVGCATLAPENRLQSCIEWPAFPDVPSFQVFLRVMAEAAAEAGIHHLVWRGFPPPVDHIIIWLAAGLFIWVVALLLFAIL